MHYSNLFLLVKQFGLGKVGLNHESYCLDPFFVIQFDSGFRNDEAS